MNQELAGKRVVVAGLGLFGGGLGAARWALAQGAMVTVTDLRDAEVLAPTLAELAEAPGQDRLSLTLGDHVEADFQNADLIVLNPGIPPSAKVMGMAASSPGRVTTAMALTLELAKCRVAAVTGTQGKSSTATFLTQILRHAGRSVEVGGNIGGSLLESVSDLGPDDVLVLELSSYQLHHLPQDLEGVLDLAAVTNLGADHLAWHGSLGAYHGAKHRIWSLLRPGGTALAPREVAGAVEAALRPGIELVTHGPDGEARVGQAGEFLLRGTVLGHLGDLTVPGDFQRHNVACALAAAHRLGVSEEDCQTAVSHLDGLPHRMQCLGTWTAPSPHGAAPQFRVFDNGISTTPDSTLAAMESIDRESRSTATKLQTPKMAQRVLLAGGAAKTGLEFGPLADYAAQHGWLVAPFGRAESEIRHALTEKGTQALPGAPGEAAQRSNSGGATMENVWQKVLGSLSDGATVLFSPACASFDAFPNFQSRAVAFRACLRASATERKNTRD